MEAEIDLRQYVALLLERWWILVGVPLLLVLIALGISFLLTPQYEAETIVVFTQPQYLANFDPRFETVGEIAIPYKGFPELATSATVVSRLREVIEQRWPAYGQEIGGWQSLEHMLEANSMADPSLLVLTVLSPDPRQSADLVDAWAEVIIEIAQDLYGRRDQEGAYFEGQLAQAEIELGDARKALVEFQSRNMEQVLDRELSALQENQSSYLREQKHFEDMLQDLDRFITQLEGYKSSDSVPLRDDLTALFLQAKAFNVGQIATLELQVDGSSALDDWSVGDLRVFLQGLEAGVQTRLLALDIEIDEIEPQVLILQGRIQEYRNEKALLSLDIEVLQEMYEILSRKVEEVRLQSDSPVGGAYHLGPAAVPSRPARPRKLLNAAAAAVLGFFAAIGGILAWEWWRKDRPTSGCKE